jgi:hypothetical protein
MSKFRKMVTDAVSAGVSPRQAIADALDYGVPGMHKGVHKASSTNFAAARGIGRGLAKENAEARRHGIKPGHTIATSRGHEKVSHVAGTTVHTEGGNMYHATKVRRI